MQLCMVEVVCGGLYSVRGEVGMGWKHCGGIGYASFFSFK